MTKKRDTKSPASVLQRLRNACVEGQSVQNAQAIFVLERFLARVARSPYQDRLVLKGGILLYLMLGQWVRPTEDLDFLAMRLPGDSLEQVLAEILSIDGEDGLTFDAKGMTWEDIREESGYPCRRFTIPYHFGPKHTHFIKLDLSFGDPVTPGPQAIELTPILADFTGGTVMGYPVETLLAEKIETLIVRGLANTRSKDIFVLWVLARTRRDLQMDRVAGRRDECVVRCFKHQHISKVSPSNLLSRKYRGKPAPVGCGACHKVELEALRKAAKNLDLEITEADESIEAR